MPEPLLRGERKGVPVVGQYLGQEENDRIRKTDLTSLEEAEVHSLV